MIHRSIFGVLSALALLAGAAFADGVIKLGAIAPKTGGLAGGAVVTQWPNVQLWVEQVNARGGLNVAGEMMTIELVEYDDKTNPCLLYTSPSPRDGLLSRMPSSA